MPIYQHKIKGRGISAVSSPWLITICQILPVHQLLPVRERVHRLMPANSPLCWCDSGEVETYVHCFFSCSKNSEAAADMLRCAAVYDQELTPLKCLTLQVKSDEVFMLWPPSPSLPLDWRLSGQTDR